MQKKPAAENDINDKTVGAIESLKNELEKTTKNARLKMKWKN